MSWALIHCAPPLGHSESLLIFQKNLSHGNSFQGSKTKCSLFIHTNPTHVFTTKWITTLPITGSNKQINVFDSLCPHFPYNKVAPQTHGRTGRGLLGGGGGGMPSPGSQNFTLHKRLSLEKVCEWVINFPGKCWASLTFEIDPMRL